MSIHVGDRVDKLWLSDVEAEPRRPSAFGSTYCTGLIFDHHRTTRQGSVILSFRLGRDEVVAFFNCNVERQRGKRRGEKYWTGMSGQFLPPERGKFRSFWMDTVGKAPRRWAASHKEIRSRLKNLSFEGSIDQARKSDGTFYWKVTDLRCSTVGSARDNRATVKEQYVNYLDTNWEQF